MSTQSGGIDLSNVADVTAAEEQGTVIEVLGLDFEVMTHGKDNAPVTITVAGSFSKRYRQAQRAQTNRALKSRRTKIDAESLERQRMELAAACVIAWDGFYDEGVALDCTRANVVKFFTAAPWIMQQVEAAIEDHAGFTRTNSDSS